MSQDKTCKIFKRNTIPFLSKYELTTVLAERAAEIANGEPRTVKTDSTNPIEIAMLEFKKGTIPKKIKRVWPDGREEVWAISELQWIGDIPNLS